jgi:hypothetical protein
MKQRESGLGGMMESLKNQNKSGGQQFKSLSNNSTGFK